MDLAEFLKEGAPPPKKERSALKQSDHELWQTWKANGQRPDDLRPLLTNFRGMIRTQVNRYAGNVEVPPAAIKHEFTEQFVRALQTYDPSKGTALASWVGTNLQKGQRWINAHQNIARIAEPRVGKVGEFQKAKTQLDQLYGRDPTSAELADHLTWDIREVERMQAELRKSNIASAWEVDPIKIMPSKEKEHMLLVRYELSPEELKVYDHTIGYGGVQQLRPSEIAKKFNMSPSKVTRIRQKIADKIKAFDE